MAYLGRGDPSLDQPALEICWRIQWHRPATGFVQGGPGASDTHTNKGGVWHLGGPTEQAIFLKAPSPSFPDAYSLELDSYVRQTHSMAGVLLEVTARKGETVDIRIIDQKGPKSLEEYTVTWVRKHWVFRPNISGTHHCPVYYGIAH